MTTMVFDIEADDFLESVTKVHCISISVDGEAPTCYAGDNVARAMKVLEYGDRLVGHNILGYDLPVLHKLYGWRNKSKEVMDTLVLSRMAWPDIINKDSKDAFIPKKYWGRYSLRAFGHRLKMNKGSMDSFDTYTDEMQEYCNTYVRITAELWTKIQKRGLSAEAAHLELKFSKLAHKMQWRGIYFNEVGAAELYVKMDDERNALLQECTSLVPPVVTEMKTPQYWVCQKTFTQYSRKADAPPAAKKSLVKGPMKTKTTYFNPLSRQQVGDFLISRGWEPEDTTPTGKPKVDEKTLLSITDIPEAQVLAKIYRLQKMIGMLAEGNEAWLKLSVNNRLHPKLNTIGAVSGRTSCVRPNLQQVPSARLPYGAECRSLFGADYGYDLVSCDAKSLEVRCFAHYMAKYDSGEFADAVLLGDIHQVNADMMHCDRQTAKNTFFALIYGAGAPKISTMLGIDATMAQEMIDQLFRKRPAMRHLIDGIKRTAQKRGHLVGLDGRRLHPRSVHSSVNLLIQAAGSCVSKRAALNLNAKINVDSWNERRVAIVGFIHDELLIECKEGYGDYVLERAIHSFKDTTGQFNLRCAMDGEGSIGKTWHEVH